MATAEHKRRYAAKRAKATAKFKARGRLASFGVFGDSGDPRNPSGEYVERAKAYIFPDESQTTFGTAINADAVKFFADAESDLQGCRLMVDADGTQYDIESIEPFMPDDEVIYNEVALHG